MSSRFIPETRRAARRLWRLAGLPFSRWRRRVPVLLQMTSVECGAACLAMILSYFGRSTRVAECRDRCGVGRDGLTAKTIAEAARSFGLRVRAFSLELPAFRNLPLPAVAHWRFDHFVVVERWSPDRVVIVDPSVGRRQVTQQEFDASFTGVVLTFEPSAGFRARRGSGRPSWHAYVTWMLTSRGTPGPLIQVLGASLLLQIFGLAVPLFTKLLVDDVLPLRVASVMAVLGIGLGMIILSLLVTTYLRAALLLHLQARLDSQMMLGFLEHLLALPFRFFQQRSTGDLLMRLGSNTMIREILTGQTISTILDGGLVVTYLVILLVIEPIFGLLVLGLALLQMLLLAVTAPRMHGLMNRELSAQAESESYLVEALSGVKTLKASGGEDRALHQWSNLFFNHLNISLRRGQLRAGVDSGLAVLRGASPLVLLWVGALRVLDGTMTLGTMLAVTALAASVLTPLAMLISSGQRLQLVGAHLARLGDILEATPEQDPETVRVAPRLEGRIELEGVSFRYDPNAPDVLREISATIEPGRKVAIVGRTGAGKTTLAALLLGLYPPTRGRVLFDGAPLEAMSYRSVRSRFGVVLQEASLFSGTIRQNISFNDPTLSLERVVQAARVAAIHDEIVRMPMGYETRIAERGTGLSGGQRQRLSLARAVAHQPAFLLLDEATSHLDVATESEVETQLRKLSCTRIVIAHRLSTIRDSDLILVLDQGTIVERGSHEELLGHRGVYAALLDSPLEVIG